MLAIAGGKGGCGKTTTALGLGAALARDGRRPLVVDADCDMPNLHAMAGTDRHPGLDALADGDALAALTHRSDVAPGVDVLPAGSASAPVESAALRRLARRRRPVILDCPAGATQGAAVPLRHAEEAVVVTTAEPPSVTDAAKTARIADALGATVRGCAVTRTLSQSPLPSDSEVSDALAPVLATVPPVDGGVLGSPVGRASYDRLATALSRRNL